MGRGAAVLLLGMLLGVLLATAAPEPPAGEREQNRRQLAELRQKDPAAYAYWYHQAERFLALPAEEQARLRSLDEQLARLPDSVQEMLLEVLRRYARWQDHLAAADRQFLQEAPNRTERLRRLRQLREQQWQAALPQALRDQLANLSADERAARLACLRHDERQRRRDWRVVAHFWDDLLKGRRFANSLVPSHWEDLDPADRYYVDWVLRPRLSSEEWAQLEQAQGQWPRFPRLLLELADRYPPALSGPRGPAYLKQLPPEIQQLLRKALKSLPPPQANHWEQMLHQQEGHWPQFAQSVVALVHQAHLRLRPDWWPTTREELSEPMQRFLDTSLKPLLLPQEQLALEEARGHWPEYPQTLQRLAETHLLTVPWPTLASSRWERYRLLPSLAERLRRAHAGDFLK